MGGWFGTLSIKLPTHQQPLKLLTRTPRVPRAQLENLSSQEILLTGDPRPALQLDAFHPGLLLPRPWSGVWTQESPLRLIEGWERALSKIWGFSPGQGCVHR